MRDGPLRALVKAVVRLSHGLDAWLRRAWSRRRGTARYRLGGACAACARCCEAPSIQVGRLLWHLPTPRAAFLAWQRHVNGFECVGRERATRSFVFRCTHFDRVSRRCDSYDTRPFLCRDYPRLQLEAAVPDLFEECGHRPLAVDAEGLRRELQLALPDPDTRARVMKRLFLD